VQLLCYPTSWERQCGLIRASFAPPPHHHDQHGSPSKHLTRQASNPLENAHMGGRRSVRKDSPGYSCVVLCRPGSWPGSLSSGCTHAATRVMRSWERNSGTRLCLPGQGGIATGTTAERVFRTEAGRAVKLVSLLPGRVYLARYLPTYSCVLCAVRRTKRPPA
jgi:hypothetical protein